MLFDHLTPVGTDKCTVCAKDDIYIDNSDVVTIDMHRFHLQNKEKYEKFNRSSRSPYIFPTHKLESETAITFRLRKIIINTILMLLIKSEIEIIKPSNMNLFGHCNVNAGINLM